MAIKSKSMKRETRNAIVGSIAIVLIFLSFVLLAPTGNYVVFTVLLSIGLITLVLTIINECLFG